jgi:hypothetical protein
MMTKFKEIITKSEVQWWIGIVSLILAVTIWGLRLEGKVNTMIALQEAQTIQVNKISESVMKLWKNVVALNAKHDIPTQ